MSKKIFITGATGYLGQKFAVRLAENGHSVNALVRNLSQARLLLNHPQIMLFEGCILKKETISPAMRGCTEVYHFAALASVWNKDPAAFERINVEGLRNILDCCVALGLKNLLFTSTAGVVGSSRNLKPVAELTNQNPELETLYEKSKLHAEILLKTYLDKGIRAVIVNPSRVYGPGLLTESNGFTRLMNMYLQGRWKIKPGEGKSIGNYVFIDDVMEGFLLAMEKARPGERYLLGGVDVSYSDFFNTIDKISGMHHKLYSVPLTLMILLSYIQLGLANTFGRHPMITPAFVRKYNRNWLVCSDKAKQELGYKITPLETGLLKTLQWLGNQEKLT